jgi:hypothetical protein
MTVFDASVRLYAWFSENDSFCLGADEEKFFKSNKRKKHDREEEASAINCALKELEGMNLICSSKVGEKEVWVLKKSFESMTQTIELSPETCLSMTQIVNGLCEMLGNKGDLVDPSSVKEADIKNLIFCCAYLMDKNNAQDGE